MRFLLADSNESILGRKDWGLYVFSHGKLKIFQNFLITENVVFQKRKDFSKQIQTNTHGTKSLTIHILV